MDKIPLLTQVDLHTENITDTSFADSAKMCWVPVVDAIGAQTGSPLPAGMCILQLLKVL